MKKLLMCIAIASMAIACSSDKEEINNQLELKQKNVYHEIQRYKIDESLSSQIKFLDARQLGEQFKGYLSNKEMYTIFDSTCPVEWDSDTYQHSYMLPHDNNQYRCIICESVFDANTLAPVQGKAKEFGYSLVKYKIALDEEKDVYIITNPNYKE